jgi:hypothetical protein
VTDGKALPTGATAAGDDDCAGTACTAVAARPRCRWRRRRRWRRLLAVVAVSAEAGKLHVTVIA